MQSDRSGSKPRVTVGECEICSGLKEKEYSSYKHGWPEYDRPFPEQVSRLQQVVRTDAPERQSCHVKRCPICGTFYQYESSYEYLVNGSEDSEDLTRLTPTEARPFLDEETYGSLIAALKNGLQHPSAMTRGYSAKCLASYYLDCHQSSSLRDCLEHTDPEVVRGALHYLRTLVRRGLRLPELATLEPVFEELARNDDESISLPAGYIRDCITNYRKQCRGPHNSELET